MSDAPRKVFERLVEAQNAHDIDALVACFAQDYSSEQPAHPDRAFTGNAQVRKNWSSIFASVPDFHAELRDAAVGGDTVWGEFEWRGKRRDGSVLHSRGVIIGTVREGKLAAARLFMSDVEEAGRGIDAAVEGMAGKR
ncbi:MAG TPA: nuclear transport factor 2 family protein [Candidatus Limnocylindria bacterium]|jgi:ketosteroid isomerase-like protein|nr:nuclear transport factor 2 family protein [Candidatus Limnocylindria bacterium]